MAKGLLHLFPIVIIIINIRKLVLRLVWRNFQALFGFIPCIFFHFSKSPISFILQYLLLFFCDLVSSNINFHTRKRKKGTNNRHLNETNFHQALSFDTHLTKTLLFFLRSLLLRRIFYLLLKTVSLFLLLFSWRDESKEDVWLFCLSIWTKKVS